MPRRDRSAFLDLALVICLCAVPMGLRAADPAPTALSANDISILWPVPETEQDATQLLSAAESLGSDQGTIWPQSVMDQVLPLTLSTTVPGSGDVFRIRFPDESFKKDSTWRIASIRVDPSAPSCEASMIERLGSLPQLRLVLQPVTSSQGRVTVHDFAAHLAFDFVKVAPEIRPNGEVVAAVPDRQAFGALLDDLLAIKASLSSQGVSTDGPLRVHPGLVSQREKTTDLIRKLLQMNLPRGRLNHIAFMGIRRPQPWIFMLFNREGTEFKIVPQSTAQRASASMLFTLDPNQVVPTPSTTNFGAAGVSTAVLLKGRENPDSPALSTVPPGFDRSPFRREIPDVIANPKICHVFNTDCVSCHTESSLRNSQQLPRAASAFAFQPADGQGEIAPEILPGDVWNVRNFGWGVGLTGTHSTATMRTVNETAECVAFVNRVYLAARSNPVSHPLNLVMTAKSDADYEQLKATITAMQALPPNQNPIERALDRLGVVHDARFVFLPHNQVAVITTYDGSFDAYLDLFVDEIGDVFNVILAHVKDAPAGRVQDHRQEFRDFVHANDIAPVGEMYSAYPDLTVQAIRALQREADAMR